MTNYSGSARPGWWALTLMLGIAAGSVLTLLSFNGTLHRSIPMTLLSDRSGLVMDVGSKVKLRGVQVGRVEAVTFGQGRASLRLQIDSDAIRYIPGNVEASIKSTTVFGAKYVELIVPERPATARVTAGAVLTSSSVTTEADTLFEKLTAVIDKVDPSKLNATLTAVATALRGNGDRLGHAIDDATAVLSALNPRVATIGDDARSATAAAQAYGTAAGDLLTTLAAASTVSSTISSQSNDLDAALLGAIGISQSGTSLIKPNQSNFVDAFNKLLPTTSLLAEYSPVFGCTLLGAQWLLDSGAYDVTGGKDGSTILLDVGLALGADPYRYPDNLPITAAKGGPDGRPGCNGMPHVDQHMPVRYLVTDTGFGTGMDMRPNIGIAHPYGENWFPVTKAIPEPPRVYGDKPPAIGPVPYPGAPPYGAPLYGPDGTPLWAPPPPGAPPPIVPGIPNPPPPYGTGTGPGAH